MNGSSRMIAWHIGEEQALQLPANSSVASSNNHNPSNSLTVAIRNQQTVPWIWHDATSFCSTICPTCRTAVRGDWFRSFDLGLPSEIRSRSGCPFCQKIAELLQPFAKYLKGEQVRCKHFQLGEILITQGGIHLGRLFLLIGEQCRQSETPQTGLYYEMLREWISQCVNTHNHPLRDCFNRYQIPIDFTLVDVIDHRLVKASSRERYLMLSYVWENSNSLMTTTSNRYELEQTGSLFRHADKIGPLIRDAMELVQNLGERYLWVDSLCIEQDNSSQKLAQINLMDVIYSQALATIVAITSESASSNIPAIGTDTQPILVAPGIALDTMAPIFGAILENSLYETRGWTLQERILSQRCLFMTHHGVTFNCPLEWRDRKGRFNLQEELNTVPFLHSSSKALPELSWTTHFRAYADLVKQYTSRNLSHSTDSLNAFSGILHLFQAALGGEMISGLPEAYLDVALLWLPSGPVTRNENFPSWTWAGWTGPCSYRGPPAVQGYVHLIDSKVEEFQWAPIGRRRTARRELHQAAINFQTSEFHHFQSVEPPRLIDVLYFRTAAIGALSFRLNHGRIVDIHDRKCGIVLGDSFPDSYVSGWDELPLEYILLSIVECPGMAESHPDFLSRYWCYALLVEWHSDYAERVALCAINSQAWASANSEMKDITLR